MWVARDKDGWGGLHLWKVNPTRGNYCWKTKYSGDDSFQLDDALFPDLKWEDEPIEIHLLTNKQIRDIINGTNSLTQESYWITLKEIIERFKTYIHLDLSFLLNE